MLALVRNNSGRSAARSARTVRVREVGGSNPPAPTKHNRRAHGIPKQGIREVSGKGGNENLEYRRPHGS